MPDNVREQAVASTKRYAEGNTCQKKLTATLMPHVFFCSMMESDLLHILQAS